MTNPKREFKRVEALIYKLAWKMHRLCGIPFDELRSEGYLAFMKACSSFDPARAKFSSWCYRKVWNHLQHYLREKARDRLTFVGEIQDEMLPPVETAQLRSSLEEQFQDLSQEARQLIETIIQRAGTEPQKPAELLREACREFSFERGVDETYTKIVAQEIKESLGAKIRI